jgi:hypothetical protein
MLGFRGSEADGSDPMALSGNRIQFKSGLRMPVSRPDP